MLVELFTTVTLSEKLPTDRFDSQQYNAKERSRITSKSLAIMGRRQGSPRLANRRLPSLLGLHAPPPFSPQQPPYGPTHREDIVGASVRRRISRCQSLQRLKFPCRKKSIPDSASLCRMSTLPNSVVKMSSTTQTVQSKGIFHGLPTYPTTPDFQNLTAIVTGANGISGYHMMKVLAAAPERWGKIYCLSRRPPPDYFFEGLGDQADRVEHVEVDFLADPDAIGKSLAAKVARVDHVFFFSYMQPAQKGGILGMWSDADELTRVNASLLENFIGGLKVANLTPKRFLLQTGAKQYGFHIGPATSPSFESDPRITSEKNFYYAQEDILSAYCHETGTQWQVVRPSYIIGAVRDNLLNHLVGIAVYASVQAYLKEPLSFPGDYIAWDREYCQSTALLNAYLEEWAVLSPHTGNQAFNAQDGLPFTWGRLWPYLAEWYGTSWNPPEGDPSKYTTTESRSAETPRGYGPRGVTRSSFSFMEWSEQPKVVQAWKELTAAHGLLLDPFADRARIFSMTDSAVIGGWPLSLSMRKAVKLGWHGCVDSYESAFHTLRDLARIKVAPPPAKTTFAE